MSDIDRQIRSCRRYGKLYYEACKQEKMRVVIHNRWVRFIGEVTLLLEMASKDAEPKLIGEQKQRHR